MSRLRLTPRPNITAASSTRRNREGGTTIVEAAFAIPIFFLLLLGLVDIGLGVLQTSQATSGASDGARVAVVWPTDPTEFPAHFAEVRAAVRTRVVGQTIPDSDITITCSTPDGTSISCTSPALNPRRDRVQVTVKWRWRPVSFVGAALPVQDITGATTMAIISQPGPAPVSP